jgi:S1-C subfamily serine protease
MPSLVGRRGLQALLVILISLAVFSGAAWADQTSAMQLYAAKKYSEALAQFLPMAEGGNPVAQFFVGVIFDNGQSVPVDHAAAVGWYQRAAEQGHPFAQLRLAQMLNVGEGGARDQRQSLKWALIAETGNLPSERRVAAQRLRDQVAMVLSPEEREAVKAEVGAWSARVENRRPPLEPVQGLGGSRLRKRGSGFFVDTAGHFLTNYHVVDGCTELRLGRPQGAGTLQLAAVDAIGDLALLVATPPAAEHVSFETNRPPTPGDGVIIVGYPIVGPELFVTTGIVNARVGSRGEHGLVQLSAGVVPGASGSPVFYTSGAVLGIVSRRTTGTATGNQSELTAGSVAVAMPIVARFLQANGIAISSAEADTPLPINEIVARGSRAAAAVECWR